MRVTEVPGGYVGSVIPTKPDLDLVDETFIAVAPATVAAAFADPRHWSRFWPGLKLRVYADRGADGMRWTVGGPLVGTMEVWCEPMLDGTLLHYYLRATPADRSGHPVTLSGRALRKRYDELARAAKANALALKDALEAGRRPGMPPE